MLKLTHIAFAFSAFLSLAFVGTIPAWAHEGHGLEPSAFHTLLHVFTALVVMFLIVLAARWLGLKIWMRSSTPKLMNRESRHDRS